VPQPIVPQAPRPATVQPQAGSAFALPASFTLKPRGSGQPLPEPIQKKMESFFNTNFADVRIHVGHEALSIGALAFTHGTDLYFAPGQYNPQSTHGQQLLGHELTHVVQQRAGRVRNPLGSGVAVVQDPALESEAERMGLRAASASLPIQAKPAGTQQVVAPAPGTVPPPTAVAANGAILPARSQAGDPVQRKPGPILPAKPPSQGQTVPASFSHPQVQPKMPHSAGRVGNAGVIMRYRHLTEDRGGFGDWWEETRYSNDAMMYVRGPRELYASADVVTAANQKLTLARSLIRLRHVAGENPPDFLTNLGRVYLELDRPRVQEIRQIAASENRTVPDDQIANLTKTLSDCHVTSQMVMGSVDSQRGTSLEVAFLGAGRTVVPVEGGEPIANRLATAVIGDWNQYRERGRNAAGINERAQIEVGLALTQVNDPVEKIQAGAQRLDKWNFHWAGIILETDSDYVILENFALDSLTLMWNEAWRFRMHSKVNADQSFHAENTRGPYATATTFTVAVKATPPLASRASAAGKKCTLCGAILPNIEALFQHKKTAH